MNERALKVLEYNKIIDILTDCAGSSLGKEKCRALKPLSKLEDIREMQKETADALSRIYRRGSLSFSGIHDVRASIRRLEISSCLGAGELMHISSLLTAVRQIRRYGVDSEDGERSSRREFTNGGNNTSTDGSADPQNDKNRDSLSERFELLEPLEIVNGEIGRCIISEEEIADDASPGLKSVRRQIKVANDKIKDQLNSIVNSKDSQIVLQDNIITMRDGRYCLPVKSEYKNKFDGMVHDQSSSGSTFFIEPMAVVKLNNELRELAIKEQDEIEKVLQSLSNMLYGHTKELQYDQDTITELDFIFARAQLAKQMKASEPVFNDRGYINIKKGRHPLIDSRKVVPTDIWIGKDFSLLIITGPNTGGKTVSLKTVGLFTLMGQSGLHIPAFEGSELAVFNEVFADIGDEQSIEQSLSTFSSHMTNTVSILKQADEYSLVLFDELGAGTDPIEGAALAMAILTYLHNRDIRVIATTHYSELKLFALSTPGVSNASCEFDVETLSPTYRLLIGMPGKSNAFAISKKLGLSDEIIGMADSFIGTRDKSFEDIISELDRSRKDLEEKNEAADKALAEAEKLRDSLVKKNERIDAAKDKILNRANEEARDVLQKAKDYADETIRRINRLGTAGSSMRDLEQERSGLREKLDAAGAKENVRKTVKKPVKDPDELKIGDDVLIVSMGVKGKVSSLPNQKGELFVQVGAMRTSVKVSDIELTESEETVPEKKATGAGKIAMSKSMSISTECNIIGMRVDEALPIIDKYLDDAYLAHLTKVSIIHGRGTGALRDAVHKHLRSCKYVKSYRLGEFGEGDRGVTIVEFKEG
ncbi:MAG: endonuclease MutS2 [Lachnospiraceae bacterium]|nr:endonuclease MutS2 [Lachnospiraceae bacterium]